ncbi:hypothetical protein CMUS01_14034 [Colletotrichum musicola]|uniref:Uncharacterized protein n=1 Tax=Colletotrichum musicola TaxID=2175873 RepID=A0A8H6J895_9PEZI|nr:hypothetical protein CMUS01_14034 [Colletotrichum musicola]
MVSFFGLKLGADKKKKTERAQEPKPAPTRKRIDQNTLGEGQFFGSNLERPVFINGSRPGTAMSNKSFVANFAHPNSQSLGASPYNSRPGTAMSNKNFVANFHHPNAPYLNGGASSMVDLGGTSGKGGGVRPMGSESNLKMGWNNGSVTNLSGMPTPPIITSDSRPGTPNSPGIGRGPKWIHPLDVHFNRDGALSPAPSSANSAIRSPGFAPSLAPSAAPSVSNAPRSPLGQFEFNLNPSETMKPNELTPAPLSPTKSYPSPPQSVNGSLPPLKTDLRPKTANGPVSSIRDAHRPGPAALPSPTTSAERTSEEDRYYPRPIIQNVAAKRDTLTSLTVHTPRRQSFSMNIHEGLTGFNFGGKDKSQDRDQQPINLDSQPAPTSPPPRSRLRPTPPELKNLNLPPAQLPPQGPLPRSPGDPPPRPPQVPYEGPLRSPARAPDDWVKARERIGSDARDQTNAASRDRMNSDPRERINEPRARHDSDPRERTNPAATRIPESRLPRNEPTPQPQGYFGPRPPPSSRRVPPGEGERSYGITPANRRPPPPPVELQRKASNPQIRQGGWEDRDVQHGNFSMISPRMQPPTPNTLAPQPSSDANWPLPSPLASPTFGSGSARRPYTPSEQSEGQMSPGLVMPATPGREQGQDYRRPDFGLRAPTGIADEFRIGFI